MRLCVVSPFPPELTGVGQYGWNVVGALAQRREIAGISVLSQRGNGQGAVAGDLLPPRVQLRRVWRTDDYWAGPRLANAIRSEAPDVVWFNLGFTVFGQSRPANFLGLMAPLLVQRTGRPLVVTLHEIVEATPLRTIGAKNGRITTLGLRTATHLLLRAGVVCVTLRRYQDVLQTHYQARNVHHIPLGALSPLERLEAAGPASEDLLFFGSVAPFKGLNALLQAYAALKGSRPGISLTIAGSEHPRFPGYLGALHAFVQSLNGSAPADIRWLGAQPEGELRALFARARVVVLPYTATTGASSVLFRAAAYGRPIVASDLPDIRAAVEEGDLRVVYARPGDPACLAEAIANLLADPARQAELAAHNLAAMRRMTLDQTCARYLALFRQAAAPAN